MREFRRLIVIVPAILLLVLLGLLFATRGAMEELAFLRKGNAGAATGLVDQLPYQTAQTLSGLAVSSEEQGFAQSAERLADHEVDQAFAAALRKASLQTRVLTGEAARLNERVTELKGIVKDDQARVDALTAAAKTSGVASAEGDDLDVAKAQLGLDQDELTDAGSDLARASGDRRGEIQAELQARDAAMKKSGGEHKETAVAAAKRYGTLWGRGSAWLAQRSRVKLLQQAEAQALVDAASLEKEHDEMEQKAVATQASNAKPGAPDLVGSQRVAMLKGMASRRVLMSIADDRVSTDRQLAAVYAQWQTQVWVQHRIVGHLVLQSLAWVVLIVLLAALAIAIGQMALGRMGADARKVRTLETLLTLAVEGVALVSILLIIWGVPEQMPTILGLAGAGLTVVFQDFILAFFGWFVLMGRNGIRPCDWVEIGGVGGEVTEIGLFRTTLLETGNWTSRGHPTGRKVTFINSFAIRGQYFNFTTHGQWMWDEIKLNVPATANAYDLIKRMQAAVEAETAKDTEQAEAEWRMATKKNGLSQFSAAPTVDLRPAASGVDVLVRFVTRASDRFELRKRIYEAVVGMMEGTERTLEGEPDGGSASGSPTVRSLGGG